MIKKGDKIVIKDNLVEEMKRLTPTEFEVMKRHVDIGKNARK